ncbi:MAG: hypothetical protein HDR37_10625 [Treponema sp.]|nr:hypothetical protein [Treponema sp.]
MTFSEHEERISDFFLNHLKSKKLELIVPVKTIKKLNAIYKNFFCSAKNFDELNSKFDEFRKELNLSPAAFCELKKQFEKKMALQPSVLTECFIAQTLANSWRLDKFEDLDAKGFLPSKISNTLFGIKNKRDGASFRYIYFNDKADCVLVQCGDSSTIDAVFIKEKIGIRIEFKEELAKINEVDIPSYDDGGKLLVGNDFKSKYPYYAPFVEIFNNKTNIFKMMGHNFKLADYLDEENSKRIIENIVDAKFIDAYILLKGNSLIPVLGKNLHSCVGFSGSEIRTAGKNSKKLWSIDFAKNEIARLGGKIVDGKVFLPLSEKMYVTGRGMDIVTRYKINPLIFVRIEHTEVANGIISFDFEKIEQLKPTISLHLSPL